MKKKKIFLVLAIILILTIITSCKKFEPESHHFQGTKMIIFLAERCNQIPNQTAETLLKNNMTVYICPSYTRGDSTCNVIWIRCWGPQLDPYEWKRRPHQNPR